MRGTNTEYYSVCCEVLGSRIERKLILNVTVLGVRKSGVQYTEELILNVTVFVVSVCRK